MTLKRYGKLLCILTCFALFVSMTPAFPAAGGMDDSYGPPGADAVPDTSVFDTAQDMLTAVGLSLLDPANKGTYERGQLMPDTLDLADRGAMAVRGLTNFLEGADPAGNPDGNEEYIFNDYTPYGHTIWHCNEPFYSSIWGGGFPASGGGRPNWGKITDATLMARNMSGSDYNLDIQLASLKNMLDYMRAGGQYEGRVGNKMESTVVTSLSRAFMTVNSLYTLNPGMDGADKDVLIALVDEIAQACMHNATFFSEWDADEGVREFVYGANYFGEREDRYTRTGNLGWVNQTHCNGTSLRALSRWGITGYDGKKQDAVEDVTELYRNFFLMSGNGLTGYDLWEPEIAPDAANTREHGSFNGHIHSYMCAMLGIAKYGEFAADAGALEFARGGYEYFRNFGVAAMGLYGESCAVGDMTLLAVILTRAGAGDYWDDIERYVRNQLTEVQITDETAERLAVSISNMPPIKSNSQEYKNAYAVGTTNNVLNRSIGTFLSDGSRPTHMNPPNLDQVICCTGNAPAGMYYAWEAIVTERNGLASVNLPLNRSSKWLNVDSYLPYEGKVILKIKDAKDVAFRVPNYADRASVRVNGSANGLQWADSYLYFTGLSSGDEVVITFDQTAWEETYVLMWKESESWKEGTDPKGDASEKWSNKNPDVYTLTFKANTICRIETPNDRRFDKKGQNLQLYVGREDILTMTNAPMKTADRYVPDVTLTP